ncbi:hypothetical protein KR009_009792 [Drosophila setifemur]|nr:hypothetical protein KR009_009792 [Drosophila setifemur]
MKKKQVKSDSDEEVLLSEDSDASGDEEDSEVSGEVEELQEEDTEASDEEAELDLAASSTESDDDSDEEATEKAPPKTRAEIIDEQIHTKYEQLKGTRLYVRFPKKLPLDLEEFNAQVKALHPLVLKSSKPRQKHARFCLVEFKSQEDRDKAFEDIKASTKKDAEYKGLFVSLPKTDSAEFVNELVTKKQLSVEKKRTKSLMKKATKKVQAKGTFTSSVVITNLPKTSSVAQVRELFQEAVDIQMRPGKGKFREFSTATVTLPTTHDARKAIKQKLSLSGTELVLRFNTKNTRKPKENPKLKEKNGESPEKKPNKDSPQKHKQKDNQKSKAQKGESPETKKPYHAKPIGNLKRKATAGEGRIIKTSKKLKKLTAD